MGVTTTQQQIKNAFPRITEMDLLNEITEQGVARHFKEGESLIEIGQYVSAAPLILSGTVKVSRVNEKGQEAFLYYLQQGDTCADTLQCCFTHQKSHINATAVEDTHLLFVDTRLINLWSSKYQSWKEFMMLSFKDKFNQLLETIDAIAFQKIDERLLRYLQEKKEVLQTAELQITHQEIAYDLTTSREVISRLLKTLEKSGMVKLGRNRIKLL